MIQERASTVNLGQNSRADDGQAGRDSRGEARPSLEVSRADFESQSERGEEEQITEGPLEAIPVHDRPPFEPLPEATASESSWETGLRSQHSTVTVAHLQAENARLQEQMGQQMALMQQVLNTLQLSCQRRVFRLRKSCTLSRSSLCPSCQSRSNRRTAL